MLRNNILSNLLGNGLTAIVSIICIPIYVHYLGVEAFGLIGFFASLQIIFSVLDMGLSATLNREFARLSVVKNGVAEQRDLLRTFEFIYFAIAIGIGLFLTLASGPISKYWLSNTDISPVIIRSALIQMGVLLALRWPSSLYSGGLMGLQKQSIYNIINTTGELAKALGCIVVLAYIDNSITAFFYCQIVLTAVIIIILRTSLWRKIPSPASVKASFSKSLLAKNKSFAAGMGATSLVVIILTQTDKIILSKLLTLTNFGYFTLASAIASALFRIVFPVSQAVYPRLVQLVHSDRNEDLKKVFHVSCQLMALIILPFALTIAFFSREVIFIWTKDAALTEEVYPLVRILIIGVACNAFVTIPYMLQLAYGWTKLGLYQNIIALFLLIPSLIVVTNIYGATGAAWAWTILNLCYILFSMPVMFRRYLKTEQLNWYLYDIILPIIYASLLMTAGKILLGRFPDASQFFLVIYICLFAMISVVVLTFTSKYLREILYLFLQKRSLR